MKRLIPLMLVAFPSFANIVDSTYVVVPPVADTQCPAIQLGLANPCYYVAIGEYTDTYQFTVVDDTLPYSFEVTGTHWHRCVASGRAHPCYTESDTIIHATVVDLGTGDSVLELVNTAVDDWMGTVQLPVGDYALVIMGMVGGNRPGVYGYSIMFPAVSIE
jgi:hypothetical protein